MLFIIEIYVLEEGLLVLGNDLPVTYNIFNKDFLETKNKGSYWIPGRYPTIFEPLNLRFCIPR
jgi:hypothetical protein